MNRLLDKVGKINIADVFFFIALLILFTAPEHALLSQVANLCLLGFLGVTLLEKKENFRIHSIVVVFCVFVFICFVSCIYSVAQADSITRTKTLFQLLIPLCACINYFGTKENLNKFIHFYSFAAIASCVYMTLMEDIFSGEPIGTSIANQNQVGTRLALAVVFLIFDMLIKFKWWKVLVTLVPVTFVVLTASRSSLIVMVISSVFMVVLGFKARKKPMGVAVLVTLIVVLLFIYLIFNVEFLYDVIGYRLEGALDLLNTGEGDASANRRAQLIAEGWQMFNENPIFGMGLNTYKAVSKEVVGYVAYSHNDYMELLVGTGLVGTITYYVMYGILIVCSMQLLKGKPKTAIFGALCFSLMAGMMTSNFFTVNHTEKTMIMTLAFVYSTYLVKKETVS